MSPGERLAALVAVFGGPDPLRLLAWAPEAEEVAARQSSILRAPRRERLAALAAATASPRAGPASLTAFDRERAGVRRLAAALCLEAPPKVESRRGSRVLRRLLLERLLSEGT